MASDWKAVAKALHRELNQLRSVVMDLRARTKYCPESDCASSSVECITCGRADCPYGEALHYHHDGCPACPCYCDWEGCAHWFHKRPIAKQRQYAKRAHVYPRRE